MLRKEKGTGKIDLAARLKGRQVGTYIPDEEPSVSDAGNVDAQGTAPSENLLPFGRKLEVEEGRTVILPPGMDLKPFTPEPITKRVSREEPQAPLNLEEAIKNAAEEEPTVAQPRSLANRGIKLDQAEAEEPKKPEAEKPAKKAPKENESPQMTFFDSLDVPADSHRASKEAENDAVKRTIDKIKAQFNKRILSEKTSQEFKTELEKAIDDALKDEAKAISEIDRPRVCQRILDLIVGYGPLQSLIDKGYNEIMVTRYDNIYVEEGGKMVRANVEFGSEQELETLISSIVGRIGKSISTTETICDGYLADDGSRFNAVFPPTAADGATLTIRRFPDHKLTGEDYLRFQSLDERILKFLELTVRAKWTTICSGGTGSGKTSLLNLMSNFLAYDPGLSVVTIEDSLELRINHPNVRREETRKSDSRDKKGEVTARDLVKNALRQRPDVIVIGEIRDGTMADFLRAAGSGHDGCLTTVHANSPEELESQVVVLFKMASDYALDADTIRMMYAAAVDLVVQIKRYPDHKRRISQISHVVGYGDQGAAVLGIKHDDPRYSPNRVYVEDIYRWRKTGTHEETVFNKTTGREETHTVFDGVFEPTGYIPKGLIEKASNNGVDVDVDYFFKKEVNA